MVNVFVDPPAKALVVAFRKSSPKIFLRVPQPIDGLNVLEQNLEARPPAISESLEEVNEN